MKAPTWLALVWALATAGGACAGTSIPLFDGADGATCHYFNQAGRIKWRQRGGDWVDARGEQRGAVAHAVATVEASNTGRRIEWDVTSLARAWLSREADNDGVAIAMAAGGPRGVVVFHTRESQEERARPRLTLEWSGGARQVIAPSADVHLDCSTVRGLGREPRAKVEDDATFLLRFELPEPSTTGRLRRASLSLMTTARPSGGMALAVYRIDAPRQAAPGKPELGLAQAYVRDQGIDKHPDVMMAENFESLTWPLDWTHARPDFGFRTVARDAPLEFEPLVGKALRVAIPRGGNTGLDLSYGFKEKTGEEPEEIYFRYYLRLAPDFVPIVDGGKLPGLAGTYGRAGWGGRRWDGQSGWSMRGGFARAASRGNPIADFVPVGTYAYHAGAEDFWGDHWPWDVGLRGLLRRNRWYCIEQYFRVNRVGADDAELKVWVDGELAMQRTGIRVRDVPEIRIERIWMNVYHGGTAPAAADLHLFIDNVVVARRYIGPMRTH